ncbi:MAG: PocR ligand-binding domain-containing protein [Desulfohalobiaceae bacterium]|nr:PocR ligand-binding domain-containing protein [Desulfohalobiaceae bacterium]
MTHNNPKTPTQPASQPPALKEIVDVPAIQALMDEFYALTNIGMALLDLKGEVLVSTGWQDICTRFHRVHPETAKNCLESDLELSNGVEPGTFRLYRCKNNMWDIATPLVVGKHKVGNLFLGQFLYEDETVDLEIFRRQAREYGFDEAAYLEALQKVPRWSRETVNTVMRFYTKLAHLISELSYSNLRLEQNMEEKNELLASLRQGEAKYRALVENLNDVVYTTDAEGRISYLSPPAVDIFGYRPEELMGRHFADFIHPGDRKRISRAFADILSDRLYPSEYRILTKDKGVRWVRSSSRPVLDNERIAGLQGVLTDVTEQKQAEQALQQSKQRFETIFNSQLDAIFVLNSEIPARIEECNTAVHTLFGYQPWELIGKSIDRLHVSEVDQRAFEAALYAAVSREGCLQHFEFSMKRKDGAVFPTEHTVLELKDETGQRSGWISVVRDVSERKRMEKRLQQAQKMEAIGTLAGGIAHDFNNILYPLMGFTELLKEDVPQDSPLHSHIDEILQASMRARDLVKQILAFSRQSEQKYKPIRVQPIVKEALKLLRASLPAEIDIQQDIQSDCGLVVADPTQIHQILMNLATNAYQAMEESGGCLMVGLENIRLEPDSNLQPDLAPGAYVRLRVEDTGKGIEEHALDKIFEPYFTTKEVGRGTGLGLSVVQGIVKKSNGDIQITSTPGRGTEIRVYLPVLEDTRQIRQNDFDLPVLGGTESLLLVDDELPIIKMEQQILERLGYRVTARTGSVEALEAFKADPYAVDLVITDLSMPNMGGLQLCTELKRIRPDIPVVLCTGFSDQINAKKRKNMGIDGFVLKPVVRQEIAAEVRRVLEEREEGN